MYCPECGHQNPDTAKFCIECGYQYTRAPDRQTHPYTPPTIEQTPGSGQRPSLSTPSSQDVSRPRSSGKKFFVGLTVAILLVGMLLVVVGIIVFIVYQGQQPRSGNSSSGSSSQEPRSDNSSSGLPSQESKPLVPEIRRGSQRLVEQAFIVGSGRDYSVKFTIPDDWRNATVVGNFVASGGGGNDIQVFITDESGLTNIRNGHSGKVWYDSGKVTTDNIHTNLAPGMYYLVFSNSFSVVSNKAINSDIKLEYEY